MTTIIDAPVQDAYSQNPQRGLRDAQTATELCVAAAFRDVPTHKLAGRWAAAAAVIWPPTRRCHPTTTAS